MAEYEVVQILDMIDGIGEEALKEILSDFSCPLNSEIENFLIHNAVEFAKKKMSITHLVFDREGQFVAFFTLTHKPVTVMANVLSRTAEKKMAKHAKFDEAINGYSVSAFLIAQFGKNYSVRDGKGISGDKLMDLAYDTLVEVQHHIGGGVAFLECEDRERLIKFYESDANGFRRFGERFSESDHIKYIQLLRFL